VGGAQEVLGRRLDRALRRRSARLLVGLAGRLDPGAQAAG
jgi:hypothetical protein